MAAVPAAAHEPPFVPAAAPLRTLQDLLSWAPGESRSDAFVRGSRLPQPPCDCGMAAAEAGRPRLLVCHDLRGGYTEDAEAQGGALGSNAFCLWDWDLVDTFVYFSHELVTVPPPGWISAAHLHGTQVLGTFITEWEAGAELCGALLASPTTVRTAAAQLASIADYYGFDGWLVNIENEVDSSQVPLLIDFVAALSTEMHQRREGSLVIWYDSVTEDGRLQWQDGLTDKNSCFFAAADGIFTNYCWKEGAPKQCAQAAGARHLDVFMGIDAYGRGTYGGGGYQCDLAVREAFAAGTSVALFGPAWPYENEQEVPYEAAQLR
eukprot:SM000207S06188  [mRNA]  locus=s207:137974:139855:- [translate_table: standard]